MATSWDEARQAAMFKRVEDGFIFRAPGLFSRNYLVTEAQKVEIQRLMRRPTENWRDSHGVARSFWIMLLLLPIFCLVMVVVAVFLNVGLEFLWRWANGFSRSDPIDLSAVYPVLLFFALYLIVPGRLVMTRFGQIGRILKEARHSRQRITLRDRNEAYARLWPLSKLLAAGVACALGCALCAMIAFGVTLGKFAFGHNPQPRLAPWLCVILLALFAIRVFYLAILKLSLGRTV